MKKRFFAVSLSLIFALAVIVFPFSASNVEAKGVSGTIKINNETYKYIEESFGKNRGITFNPGNHTYTISPNPHNNPKYNKKQVQFYAEIANGVKAQVERSGWKSSFTGIQALGETYTLSPR
ncbi:hypothetical protein NDS46_20420 [Paenibacillus thiaminolyticus]|uniref:hypothetical protein n=1 Tax=Paenibacillus thiaminolyticus TaxID=49283 RepID=UPI00232F143C|nr:hypothetical protein [Paenibacillus thiaminolyticus]WCF06699.1 hypothetical protein NDS46_20420 [Paenibacillus thiaminolyticus]